MAGMPNTHLTDAQHRALIAQATDEVAHRQKSLGISIPSNGELGKISYVTYIKDRLSGFRGDSPRRTPADLQCFPSYCQRLSKAGGTPAYRRPCCVGPIKLKNLTPLRDELEMTRAAFDQAGYQMGFINAVSPGTIALFHPSDYHVSHEAYLRDLAQAMTLEYREIIRAGFMLQIDSPDLALGRHMMFADRTEQEFLKMAALHAEVLNEAVSKLPADKLRLHICWGNYEGPHHRDIPIEKLFPILFGLKPRRLLFEAANPRHAHEWSRWRAAKIPDDYVLVPGVVDTTINFIEHPELVAQRIRRFTSIVGRDRVVAGTDCGFATFAGFGAIDQEIAWEKLKVLVQGAEMA